MENLGACLSNKATLGQWAIARLQAEAKEQLSLFLHDEENDGAKDEVPFIGPARDPQTAETDELPANEKRSDRPELSVGRYRGVYGKGNGTLCLDLNQMHFEAQMTGSPKWSLRYDELKSLRKVRSTLLINSCLFNNVCEEYAD